MSDPPSTPTVAKSNPQFATKASSAALSVASEGSGTSANSGKHSLNHTQTSHSDESQKKHRDVGEVVAGLFSRKKRGRKGAEEHDHEDRGESRDGAGSEASSLLDAYGDEHGSYRPYSPIHSPVRDRSTESLPEIAGTNRRATSPTISIQRNPLTPIKTSPRNSNSGGVNAEATNPIKTPITASPSRSAPRSRRGGSLSMDLKITPTSSGSAPETTVTPPTPTSPPARGIRGNRSGSLSNTPSKLSQSMTHPLTPTAEGMPGSPMAGVDDNRSGTVTTVSAGDGANGKSGGGQGANSASGFFSSMISAAQNAAQNAATTLSNTVANNIVKGESRAGSGANTPDVGRSRSGTETEEKLKGDTAEMQPDTSKEEQPKKRLAVETLGQGELSLGSLGISNGSKTDFSKNGSSAAATAVYSGGTGEKPVMDGSSGMYRTIGGRGTSEDVSRAPGGTQTNTETAATDTPTLQTPRLPTSIVLPPKTPMAEDIAFNAPPIHAPSPGYENTIPNVDDERDEWLPSATGDSLKRSGSARSNRGSGVLGQARRPRGSSAASSLANHLQTPTNQPQSPASPSGSGLGPKITGFAVASKKRNRDFHSLFRSVPEDDYLIEDYGCALQKDILLHGRLYVSEGHICFNSNILGWINTLVISFDEVMAIEKKSTALLFPNAIVIQTLHARNVFASFISRDTTYDLLVNIWKISHPGLIPSVAGYTLEKQPDKANGTGDGKGGSESEDEYDEDEEGYEEEDDYEEGVHERESMGDADGGFGEMGGGGGSAPNGTTMNGNVTSIATGGGGEGSAAALGGGVSGALDATKAQDFPGPATHSATDCGDHELHYERIVCDEYLPGPLGKVYALLFGSQSNSFLTKFLEDQKVMELSIPNNAEWAPSPEAGGKSTRSYSYIRPLPGAIGPKQTKCICTEQLEQMDLEKAVSVLVTTQTPDVPSGNQFSVKTRYCLTWGDGSMTGSAAETRMQLNCTIEWTGKSWLKGPIEKGCNDGQITHGKDLTAALKRELERYAASSKSRGKSGAKGGKKGKGDRKGAQTSSVANSAAAQKAAREKEAREKEERENAAWGVFLPLKPVLGLVLEMVPGGGIGLLIGLGILLMIICVFMGKLPFFGKKTTAGDRSPSGRYPTTGMPPGRYGSYPDWEQSWHAEEQGLWDWLEDRVGLNAANMGGVPSNTQEERRTMAWNKLGNIERNQILNRIGEVGGMGEREVEEAMKVMEKRLEILRAIVSKRKSQQEHARRAEGLSSDAYAA